MKLRRRLKPSPQMLCRSCEAGPAEGQRGCLGDGSTWSLGAASQAARHWLVCVSRAAGTTLRVRRYRALCQPPGLRVLEPQALSPFRNFAEAHRRVLIDSGIPPYGSIIGVESTMALKLKRNQSAPAKRARGTKFQADLAPAEERALRALKQDLQLRSNTDFLADAVALFRWAVSERRLGHRIVSETPGGDRKVLVFPRLERVAPEASLPRVEIAWTEDELASLAELVSSAQPGAPTEHLVRAVRD